MMMFIFYLNHLTFVCAMCKFQCKSFVLWTHKCLIHIIQTTDLVGPNDSFVIYFFIIPVRIETYDLKDGKRDYSKTVYCIYCKNKYSSKISSHLLNVHPNERRVREVQDLPLKSIFRKLALQKLQKEGNFQHNAEVCICTTHVLWFGISCCNEGINW